jgi:hypothetical protein
MKKVYCDFCGKEVSGVSEPDAKGLCKELTTGKVIFVYRRFGNQSSKSYDTCLDCINFIQDMLDKIKPNENRMKLDEFTKHKLLKEVSQVMLSPHKTLKPLFDDFEFPPRS